MGSANVLLVLFMVFLFSFGSSSNSSCLETEWKALMDFKGSLVDEHNQLSSWMGRDCCSWYGITCHNRTGFVQKIDLHGHRDAMGGLVATVTGFINSSLLQLEHLEHLDLSFNNFSGIRIPKFLGSLRNLRYLDLHGAKFSGEIPQQLGNLSNLHHLSLGEDYEISSTSLSSKRLGWITGLSSLRSLELFGTNLSECVDWLDSINMLSSLSTLSLYSSGLVAMAPSQDLNLTSLVSLDLSGNNFFLPGNNFAFLKSLFNLSTIEYVDLSRNGLQGPIPNMFHKLPSLNSLDLSVNSFNSSIPDSLCTLPSLTNLDITSSELHGYIPFCLGNLTTLTSLLLGGNHLSGTIPTQLGSLTQLTVLYFYNNQLSGKIPPTLGKLAKLTYLDISKNSLTGELSESFFEGLKSLERLDISKNQFIVLNVTSQWVPPFQAQVLNMESVFIGTPFPAWLQNQTNLYYLILRNTIISGIIPDWCQTSYPHLRIVDLSKNFLTGPIPTFNKAAIVENLKLSDNQFTGNIPDALCNLDYMEILTLANNQLMGRIPSCLGSLKSLYVLDLANNSFSDHIPFELGYLRQLSVLRLNGNKLVGEVPSSILQNLTSLATFDVGKNELEGFIPSWIGNEFIFLEHIMLQSNKFSGEISVNLCQLPSLRILNLAENSLVGTIPPCLGNLSKMRSDDYDEYSVYDITLAIIIKGIELEYSSSLKYAKFISLSGNQLHGEIPDELMELTWLQSLNLSNNELTGNIPRRIGNMKHLESLDLSRNRLSGTIPQSLADIDDLEFFNLSFNNLSGKVPFGGHFDTLNSASVYEGNDGLCGNSTGKKCEVDSVSSQQYGPVSSDDDLFEIEWIYAGIGPGFAVGFLGVFFLLYFKSSWRYRYFRFLENVYNRF